jgi:EF hand
MKLPLQLTAVVSSVFLTGGLIFYQAGAFDKFLRPEVTPPEPPPVVNSSDTASRDSPSMDLDAMAEASFRQQDINGDGYLDSEEMSDTLKAEREKWDVDADGRINMDEFKAYFRERRRQYYREQEGNSRPFPVSAPDTASSESSSGSKSDTSGTEKPTTKFLGGTKSGGYIVGPRTGTFPRP